MSAQTRTLIALPALFAAMVGRGAHAGETSQLDLHHSPVGASGTLAGDVGSRGELASAVPLALPPARAGMPVPVAVSWVGPRSVGAAGAGWDVPLSYVEVTKTLSGHKPISFSGSAVAAPPERVLLNIGGGETLMVPVEAGKYRAFVGEDYGELVRATGNTWQYKSSFGHIYVFSQLAGVNDSSRWYLTRIDDLTGKNRVELAYQVGSVTLPVALFGGQVQVPEVLLREVAYNHDASLVCARNRLRFNYTTIATSLPLSLQVDEGHWRARSSVLSSVEIWEHQTTACSTSAENRLQAYEFSYVSDADTGLPRLSAVDVVGQGVAPGASGPRLPVARYDYGQVISNGALELSVQSTIDLPDMAPEVRGGYESLALDSGFMPAHVMGFDDYTGDGRADFLYPPPGFFPNASMSKLKLAQGVPNGANPTFQGDMIAAGVTWPIGWAEQGDNYTFFAANPGPTSEFTATWQAMIDMNGDGVRDLVDARGGKNPTGQPDPRYWHIRLYRPQAGNGAATFIDAHVNINPLRTAVMARHDLHFNDGSIDENWNPEGYLPISRQQFVYVHSTFSCNDYQYNSATSSWVKQPCARQVPPLERSATITEWEVTDVNGDGFPDFVMNSERIGLVHEFPCPDSCPASAGGATPIPFGCEGFCEERSGMALPENNQILVFYNDGFALRPSATSNQTSWQGTAMVLQNQAACGVASHRRENIQPGYPRRHAQFMECGLVDMNGDGLVDYVEATEDYIGGFSEDPADPDYGRHGTFTHSVVLGTGLPQQYTAANAEFLYGNTADQAQRLVRLPLPGPVSQSHNDKHTCLASTPDYFLRQISSLVDLTGDGVSDYVFFGTWSVGAGGAAVVNADPPAEGEQWGDRSWWIMVGTGVGFRQPVPISVGGVLLDDFALFSSREGCSTQLSRVQAGVVDIDGDGRLELVTGISTGDIVVSRLSGATGGTNALDAGRLRQIHNGYGAITRVTYASAKSDATTPHLVPHAEIVVAKLERLSTYGATPYDPIYFAYGNAEQYYHALLGRWVFPGYGRKVTVSGTTEPNGWMGQAVVEDTWIPSALPDGHDRYAKVGRRRAAYLIANVSNPAAEPLLAARLPADSRVRAGVSVAWTRAALAQSSAAPATAEDCTEIKPLATTPLGDASLCRRNAVVLESSRQAWEGTGQPGTAAAAESKSVLLTVDSFGRRTKVKHYRDLAIATDDVCEEWSYAAPQSSAVVLTRAVSAHRITDCERPLAATRFRYDNLAEGALSVGLPTHVILERRHATSGTLLATITAVTFVNDVFGNITTRTFTRSDGAWRRETTTYDPFGMRPTATALTGSGIAAVMDTTLSYSASTRTYDYRDEHGTTWRMTMDPFGRAIRTTFRAGATDKLVEETFYQDSPAALGGRRVTSRIYHDQDAPGLYSEFRIYIDDFGRQRWREEPLGADYAGQVLVTDYVLRDGRGRPRFVADAFIAGANPLGGYGSSYLYTDDGRVACVIRGTGQQSSKVPSAADDRYPWCTSYFYDSDQKVVRQQGPDDLTMSSASFGTYQESRLSAVGRLLRKTRGKTGSPLERVDFGYDRLSNLTAITRYKDPSSASSAVVTWSYTFDSLGNELVSQEANGALVNRVYDDWGKPTLAYWTDSDAAATTRRVAYSYDAWGRMTAEKLSRQPSGGAEIIERQSSFFYDTAAADGRHVSPTNLKGRLAYVVSGARSTYFGYDQFGRRSAVTRADTDQLPVRLFTELTEHGLSGQLESLTFLLPDTDYEPEAVTYAYDSARRLRGVAWEDGAGVEQLFQATSADAFGRYLETRLGNGTVERWSYRADRRRELKNWTVTPAVGSPLSTVYESYDGEGHRLSEVQTYEGQSLRRSYEYDSLDRLKTMSVVDAVSSAFYQAETMSYDGLGNVKQHNFYGVYSGTTRDYTTTTGDPDRLCRVQTSYWSFWGNPMIVPAAAGCTHTHDALGNVTAVADGESSISKSYGYLADGHVSSMQAGTAVGAVQYDGIGGVSRVTVTGVPTGARLDRRFGQLVEETQPASGGAIIERSIPGPMGVIATRKGSGAGAETVYRHAGGHGPQLFTGSNGDAVQRLSYTAFGQSWSDSGDPNSALYTKYQWNEGDRLAAFDVVQLGERFYAPKHNRFISRDPISVMRGGSDLNPYAFAGNDPANFADPTGLDKWWLTDESLQMEFEREVPEEWQAAAFGMLSNSIDVRNLYGVAPEESFGFGATEFEQEYGASLLGSLVETTSGTILGHFWIYDGILEFVSRDGTLIEPLDIIRGSAQPVANPLLGGDDALEMGEVGVEWVTGEDVDPWIDGLKQVFKKGAGKAGKKAATMAKRKATSQIHHFATRYGVWSGYFKKLAGLYGLSLNGKWNLELMKGHLGRHAKEYHQFVLSGMTEAARLARGNKEKFLEHFERLVKDPVRKNPSLMYPEGWDR